MSLHLFKRDTIHLIFKYTISDKIIQCLKLINSINSNITNHFFKYDLIKLSTEIYNSVHMKNIFAIDFLFEHFTLSKRDENKKVFYIS